jgi:hypothetical protein
MLLMSACDDNLNTKLEYSKSMGLILATSSES